ncbi:alpha-L-rhamnosidase [Neobacillus cucumis]|uniref:alpha-L-rhamnosidase n=1 Tax=Neobacillus cucumis TaxID=1740721 RepID=UPI002852FF82|nr:family 78 glycoside hydrolase catalytic domain [Neobacillus cucumis]MDR4946054.1 family 78 glycoside hydrolase catalytic domain [Neobacillus cucumis]
MIQVIKLTIENQDSLMGTDILQPRFSWRLASERTGIFQSAYQINVFENASSGFKKLIWDSNKVHSQVSVNIPYEGPLLESKTSYTWQVRVWCSNGEESAWSSEGHWEMGLLHEEEDWVAKWIEPQQENVTEEPELTLEDMFINKKKANQPSPEDRLHPPKLVRKSFHIDQKKIEKARLYITAHGLYHAKINGQRITDAEFTPDYTSYSNYLQYQTYDVLPFLLEGENVLGVILADGWYAGRISVPGGSAQFGNRLGLLAQLEITFTDQTKQIIATDDSFLSSNSQYVYSDIFIGEKQDKNLEKSGWDQPGYDGLTHEWASVSVVDDKLANLRAQYGELVKPVEKLSPVAIWKNQTQAYIIDFGQVIAGRIRLRVHGLSGQELKFEHCEVLNENGEFFNNIVGRNKEQTDYYVTSGENGEVFEPTFTFHGFRYVRLSGYDSGLACEDIVAIVLYSNMKMTGQFTTSNPEINQLWNNIKWSQKGNMLSIPTDCPQREKAGWTGDIQVFAPTAAFNMDVQAFLTRWLWNLQKEQTEEGEILNYCPAPKDIWNDKKFTGTISSAGWGDAILIVPWVLFQRYDDRRILEQCFPEMEKWLDYVQKSAAQNKENVENEYERYLWDTKFHFGDWMIPSFMLGENPQGPIASAVATKDPIATAYYAYSAGLLAEIAKILGRQDKADYYQTLHGKVKKAFGTAYVNESGLMTADYQGVYTIALAFNLLSGNPKKKAVERLVELIEKNDFKIDTGFLSVPFIMDVLCENGYEDIAYKLLFQTACPSWLYEVKNGATTIWESWEAIKPDGTVGAFSFNHYAFGCIGDWLVRHIGGLTPMEPGYSKFKVEPHGCDRLTFAETQYESVYGEIKVKWEIQDGKNMILQVNIPANSLAVISLINVSQDCIQELKNDVMKMAYSDVQWYEEEKPLAFTAASGQINIKYKLENVCGLENRKLQV